MREAASLVGLLLLPIVAWAHEDTQARRTLSPYFFVESADASVDAFPLKDTSVEVDITGVIASVQVRQRYLNAGARPLNARYVFPGSTRAAVHGMRVRMGGEVIVATIKEREQARQEFDQAKREGKTASLLEQHRPNVFSMEVSNIVPGEEVEVELSYTELLVPTEGTYEFVYPTVVGPRYVGATETAAGAGFAATPVLRAGKSSPSGYSMRTTLSVPMALQRVSSPSHAIEVNQTKPTLAEVRLRAEENPANRDFILRYQLAGKQISSGLLLHESHSEKFFLLMVEPPQRVAVEHTPPREYVFIIDVSGSMGGFPLDTAKTMMRELAKGLREVDAFNVVLFSGTSHRLFSRSMPASEANLRQAMKVIDQQRGGGGTELLEALRESMSLPPTEGAARSLVVITDGYISAEEGAFRYVRQNLNRANVFSFGIGSSVNRHLIEGLAQAGMGEPFVVTGPEEAPRAAERFVRYIRSPVLTQVQVEAQGVELYHLEPASIPDVLAERPVVVFGKYSGAPEGTIRLSGWTGGGRFEQSFELSTAQRHPTHQALRYLWARSRIAHLGQFAEDAEQAREEIAHLGLSYSLLTQYTSFIAVRERVVAEPGAASEVEQPLPLPEGVSELAVPRGVEPGPEPALWALAGAMMLMLLAARRVPARSHPR